MLTNDLVNDKASNGGMSQDVQSTYPGNVDEPIVPLKDTGFETLQFEDPAEMFLFFNENFTTMFSLHKWQTDILEVFARTKPTSLKPLKLALRASNGSGKDGIIIAAFVIWFILTKVQGRIIVTSSSGTQLTAQTESAIKELANTINKFFGCEYIRVRQRYIYCRLSGSEIRLFATDESGKAEGYHPIKPGAEMAIVLSEWKSITEDIYKALRRCTGFNYWLGVSSPGEPKGSFYSACTKWTTVETSSVNSITQPGNYTIRVTSYDCPHIPPGDIEEDKLEYGEHSSYFRSKHLALFTSLGGEVIIPIELIDGLFNNPPGFVINDWPIRVGLDLAAGGDENCIMIVKGNRVIKEIAFRETDTTITADRIDLEFKNNSISKECKMIYADDGGVGHSVIDMLKNKGWRINRILNQWAAINKRNFGNRGAENWFRVKRLMEESMFDVRSISEVCRNQIGTRRYKQQLTGARIYLESKKEAKANGRPSPDRADALILALTGLTVKEFIDAKQDKELPKDKIPQGEQLLVTNKEVEDYHTEKIKYGSFNGVKLPGNRNMGKRVYNSLRKAMKL